MKQDTQKNLSEKAKVLEPSFPARGAAGVLAVLCQREIFDRRAIMGEIEEALGAKGATPQTARPAILEILKKALDQGKKEIRGRFEEGVDGTTTVHAQTFLIDQLIRVIMAVAGRLFPELEIKNGVTIVAVGGYGRAELAPQSDVDLLFLMPGSDSKKWEAEVEYVLYLLWDLGLKVGHATRTVAECIDGALSDITIRTTMLESRFLDGNLIMYEDFKKAFKTKVMDGTESAYIEAKLAERDERHERVGNSRYLLEPNLKEGKGGLRDLHTLFWIGKYTYQVDDAEGLVAHGVLTQGEARAFAKASNFLLTLRCHLHYLTNRPEERLTFDLQSEIGRRMGYTDHAGTLGVERFMKHYFLVAKDVGDLTRIFCATLEAERKRQPRLSWWRFRSKKTAPAGFTIEGGWLNAAPKTLEKDPVNLIRLFKIAQSLALDIHPDALRRVRRNLGKINDALRCNEEANALFIELLTSRKEPDVSLMRMNEAGVLGRFIPDFGRIVAQMQHDMYHVYTVDDHTIRAIRILNRIEQGLMSEDHPLCSELIDNIESRRVLYLAVLLHDIAKGRGGDHCELGAEIALKLGERMGLDEAETQTVSWLVRQHLLMSHTATRRDLNDHGTISDFVNTVQSPERLRLLTVLTVVDIRAVGPGVWNGWKAALLRELYQAAYNQMSGGLGKNRKQRIAAAKENLANALGSWKKEDLANFLALGYPDYWLTVDPATHVHHGEMLKNAGDEENLLLINTRVDNERAVTEVTIYTADHPGLFSRIAGAIALARGNIVDARIFTMTNGMALDTFSVQEAGEWMEKNSRDAYLSADKTRKLEKTIRKFLCEKIMPQKKLASRSQRFPARANVFAVASQVRIDNDLSAVSSVIEVSGRDRPGFLHDVTIAITDLGLQIISAKIVTYGERAIDTFYVKDVFGLRIENERKIDQIKQALLKVLAAPENGEDQKVKKSASSNSSNSADKDGEVPQDKVAARRHRVAHDRVSSRRRAADKTQPSAAGKTQPK